jgi:oligopeptide transport system ATP-binding protein
MNEILVKVEGLTKLFHSRPSILSPLRSTIAVDRVSLEIPQRSVLGLVGESGCGKSTLGYLLLRLIEPTAGSIFFGGRDISSLGKSDLRKLRPRMQVVFQDPDSSLNPRRTVQQTLVEPLLAHHLCERSEALEEATRMLYRVGLDKALLRRYPHELSGGQRQRVAIARALTTSPQFVVFDEPTSALDVSMQARILQLIGSLRQDESLSFLFISHDLGVAKHVSDRIAVMYAGQIVETAAANEIFREPLHPYTKLLVSSLPRLDPQRHALTRLPPAIGEPPSRLQRTPGCPFAPRCQFAVEECGLVDPGLKDVAAGHSVACHLYPS